MLDFLTSFIGSSFRFFSLDVFSIAFFTFLSIWSVFFIFRIIWGR